MKFTSLPFFIVLTLSCAVAAGAEFAGARIFSSQMVLQRDASVPVWGTGDDGETVAVAFRGQTKTARVQNGEWRVALDPMPASADGHPLVLESGGSRITFEDVLVGEVWLASGQSNMQMRLKESVRGEESIARAADDRLRFFVTPANVRPGAAALPLEWNISSPDTAPQVSAVAYYFAEELRRATKIPIGIIQCAYGGSRAEAWCSPELLQKGWPQFERYKKNLTEEALKQHPQRRPSSCYEHMLKPLFPFAVRGTIWYQGESNAAHAVEHRRLLPAMIREFRTHFENPDMPFYFVQLARFDRANWAAIRRAQLDVWKKTPNTSMAVTIDLPKTYNANNHPIHPNVKKPIGERLARAARHYLYGETDLVPSGPRFKEAVYSKRETALEFDFSATGLATLDGEPLRGIYAAKPGGTFKPVDSRIEGDHLILETRKLGLTPPFHLRYGSEEDMGNEGLDVNLANSAGLPASPFLVKVTE